MAQRFFVTIFAADQSALKDITKLNLDLFGSLSPKRGEASTGGLLTKAQIKKIEKTGYRVEIHDEYVEQALRSEIMAQADVVQVMDDKAWLKAFYNKKEAK